MDNPSMSKYVLRIILLLIAAGLAGGFCGWPFGLFLPGFVYGFALALGILVIHFFCRNRLTRGEPPKWKVVVLASIISGVIGGVGMSCFGGWSPLIFLNTMAFSLVLHSAYQVRWKFGVVGLLVAAILALVLCFFSAQVLGVMFGVLWLASVAACDPAWSFVRWKNCWPGKVLEGQACVLDRRVPS
jgi:hypothetical protein